MVTPVQSTAPVSTEAPKTGTPGGKGVKKAAPKPVKKAVAPKAAEKPAPTKKATKKAAPAAEKAPAPTKKTAPEPKPEPKKESGGLNKSRILLLKTLAKHGSLSGSDLAEKSGIHTSLVGNLVGYRNPEINAREVHKDNLLNRKFVKLEKQEVDGKDRYVYTITAAGKTALDKVNQ